MTGFIVDSHVMFIIIIICLYGDDRYKDGEMSCFCIVYMSYEGDFPALV